QHLGSATMPEFFGRRFDSKALKVVASMITFIFMVPYTASLYNGLSRLFEMAFHIDYTWCVVGMAVLTAVYVIIGGYMATAMADFIQGIIMLGGIVAVVAAVLNGQGGFTAAMTALSKIPAEGSEMSGAFTSFLGPDPWGLIGVVLLTSLGTWGLPQMVQKFYAIKNEGAIRKGTMISTLFALVVASGCYFLGGFGRLFGSEVEVAGGKIVFDSIIPAMLHGLPDAIIGIVIVLVLSASMSTLSSLVLASSSTITLDFINPLRKKPLEEKKSLLTMRVFIVFFIVVSAVIAIVQAKSSVTFIAQLMGISWGAMAGAFLAPFLYGLYWKGTTRAAVWISFVVGVGLMVANLLCTLLGVPFINDFFSSPINAGVLAMVLGLVLVPIVSLFTRKMDKSLVDEMYMCYNRTVNVPAKDALEDK
ncbi:MAG: sodium:solute symporter family protein, partial [Clostridia bacterium]|nr:sodium:solute symporter family protein [Clostridia bacterium]